MFPVSGAWQLSYKMSEQAHRAIAVAQWQRCTFSHLSGTRRSDLSCLFGALNFDVRRGVLGAEAGTGAGGSCCGAGAAAGEGMIATFAPGAFSPSPAMCFISLLKIRSERPTERDASGKRLAPNSSTSTTMTISQ